ncbi:MAG TPA: hypothetical protein VEL30_00125, partial [Candidatus Nitrosopolaris sp.]|nr:hypothetical protein [Candidatus Nitrosopolaris sp.]
MAFAAVAVVGALALLALWWWDRHRARSAVPASTDQPVRPRRSRPAVALLVSLIGVVAVAHLLLFAPR